MSMGDLSEIQWERLACRMLHKTCPTKGSHPRLEEAEHCPQCGLDGQDYVRFVAGDVGKRPRDGR